jgi:mannose-6-phosphate isomerase-like protein (cupin superfamily)
MKNGFAASIASQLGRLPTPDGKRSVTVFEHGTLRIKLYAPREEDQQTPHSQDEGYIVYSGSGDFVHGDERVAFGPGDFLWAQAGLPHRFENFTNDLFVWVVFYGPEGGE